MQQVKELREKAPSVSDLEEKAKLVRKWCLVSTTEAGSGHPTSCLSAADITTVLFDRYFTYDLATHSICIMIVLCFRKDMPLLYYIPYLVWRAPIL